MAIPHRNVHLSSDFCRCLGDRGLDLLLWPSERPIRIKSNRHDVKKRITGSPSESHRRDGRTAEKHRERRCKMAKTRKQAKLTFSHCTPGRSRLHRCCDKSFSSHLFRVLGVEPLSGQLRRLQNKPGRKRNARQGILWGRSLCQHFNMFILTLPPEVWTLLCTVMPTFRDSNPDNDVHPFCHSSSALDL